MTVLQAFQRQPIRTKLLAMVLMPLLVVLPLLGLILAWWGNATVDRMLITKVHADLSVARGYFERVLGEVGASTSAVAGSHQLIRALTDGHDAQALQAMLDAVRQREGLDFINLRHADGQGMVSDHDARPPALPALVHAMAAHPNGVPGRAMASVEVLGSAGLALLSPALRERVAVPLVPTRNAQPTERTQEDRAMVVIADAPVRDAAGRVIAWVQAGMLLNRNLAFIDHINQIVYPEGSLPLGSRGTATLFLDDVRISTNVRLFQPDGPNASSASGPPSPGEARAIGTRVSKAVRDAVLGEGRTWLDRAFVVNDWYVSAYQPIGNQAGQRIGMLYVGYLERPFVWLKYSALVGIGAVFLVAMLLAALAAARWARTISQPLEQMVHTMHQVEAGALGARVGPLPRQDEIGALAGHLDHLLDTIDGNTRSLQRWNAELDAKVAERTSALEDAQQQLLRSEKLAAVGQLTASIAHEVNNPIAVIQGNLDLARELLGADADRVQAELGLMDQQIERMRLIVTQLLQFARPHEYAGYVDALDPAQAFADCLVLTNHLLASARIEVRRQFAATRRPAINRNELQQVLVNLIVNAAHAMPDGGVLTLATADVGERAVSLSVSDTGAGLRPDLVADLFKPFITSKKDGTGLGLWISRSIVERYGGDITAANGPQGGAVMTVLLQCEPA
jgi:signal transduction histidine kinase